MAALRDDGHAGVARCWRVRIACGKTLYWAHPWLHRFDLAKKFDHATPKVVVTSGRSRLWLIALGGAICAVPFTAQAASVKDQLEAIYQPLRAENAVLAPDGRQIAFVVRDHNGLNVLVRDVEHSNVIARTLIDDRADVQVQFFDWADPMRLVVATDASDVVVVNTASRTSAVLVSSRTFIGRNKHEKGVIVRVVGIAENGAALTLEVNRTYKEGGVTLEAMRLDLVTGSLSGLLKMQLPAPGGQLLANRAGLPRVLWRRGETPQHFDLLSGETGATKTTSIDRIVRGGSRGFSITPQTFLGERSFPLGFDHNPDVMYYASNVGRSAFGIFALNLQTGESDLVMEEPGFDLAEHDGPFDDSNLIFDSDRKSLAGIRNERVIGGTRWLDSELESVQALLAERFPSRRATILSWDAARSRFLILINAYQDPGRYFIFDRKDGRLAEQFRRAAVASEEWNPAEPFRVAMPDDGHVEGFVTRPHALRGKAGLVVWFHDGPGQRVKNDYQPDAQALAAMGFVVAQINYRGSTGFGRRHVDAIVGNFDRPVDDAVAVIKALAAEFHFERDRVAAVGHGFGAYLALRAVQVHPEEFRCAVAINAPLDLAQYSNAVRGQPQQTLEQQLASDGLDAQFARWYFRRAGGKETVVDARIDRFTSPIFLLHDPHNPISPVQRVKNFSRTVTRQGNHAEFMELPPLFGRGLLAARAPVFEQIGDFLHKHLEESRPVASTPRR
jgi:acetyl esterase/lipase